MICLLHLWLFFAALASYTCTYSQERERERESYEKQKVRWENYMNRNIVEPIVWMYGFQNVW